jgi:hypothetical protein
MVVNNLSARFILSSWLASLVLADMVEIGLGQRDDADNGTIIDFVQNRSNLRLGEVRKELRNWKDEPRAQGSKFIPRDKPQPINSDRLRVIKAVSGFKVAQKHDYLEKRGIKQSVLKSDRFIGTVAQVKSKNYQLHNHQFHDLQPDHPD